MKKREVALQWIQRLFRDLTEEEKRLTTAGLQNIPWDAYCGSIEHLWERYQRGEIGCFTLEALDGSGPAAVSFFIIVELADESLCYESLVTVALGPTERNLTKQDMDAMEAVAKSITQNGKKVTSMAMRTPRHGLAKQLIESHGWYCSEITLRKIF